MKFGISYMTLVLIYKSKKLSDFIKYLNCKLISFIKKRFI